MEQCGSGAQVQRRLWQRPSLLRHAVWTSIALLVVICVCAGTSALATAQTNSPTSGSYECFTFSGG